MPRLRQLVRRAMNDFLAALGLVFVIEGLIFAGVPGHAKKAMASVLETPDGTLRGIGIGAAVVGLILVWLARGA
jgi:uncharacterized protein YjeT (DUF2065 family)